MQNQPRSEQNVSSIIHLANLAMLLLAGGILILAAVDRKYQIVIVLPILAVIIFYWRLRNKPQIAASFFGLSVGIIFWIMICENIVTIDNILGTQFTTRLPLGLRLLTYANAELKTTSRNYFQPCCNDPMSRHYQPSSSYTFTYDCATCNAPYKGMVDETGYLNGPRGFWTGHDQIDLFVAGDSVLQGLGVLSIMELLREQLPVTMWNLSMAGYGPRQKISALMTYALPKRPKWLVVEFYSNNDVRDAIVTEVCEGTRTFLCEFSIPEIRYRLLRHPIYSRLLDQSADIVEIRDYYAAQSFTLANTRYIIGTLKMTLKRGLATELSQDASRMEVDSKNFSPLQFSFPAPPEGMSIRGGKRLEWATLGMPLVYKSYKYLLAELAKSEYNPTVILLYNPSPYETYRDILFDRDSEYDHVAAYQLEVQRSFAQQHGWRFLDLTIPLRQELQVSKTWIFGRYDRSHWSSHGTVIVARVLRDALLDLIEH